MRCHLLLISEPFGLVFFPAIIRVGLDYLLENFFTALSAVFVAFVRQVAVYLLCTVESSGLLYTAGGNTKSFYYF